MNKKSMFPKGANVEFKIENYLENNIMLIEPELKLIARQYKVYYKRIQYIGAIDLFCQGEDGAQVVVELKSRELTSRDLGQIMAYYAVCKKRAETHKLPPPRAYCIGLSVGPQYKMGLTLLNDNIDLKTYTYSITQGTILSDKEFVVELHNYDPEEEGIFHISLK